MTLAKFVQLAYIVLREMYILSDYFDLKYAQTDLILKFWWFLVCYIVSVHYHLWNSLAVQNCSYYPKHFICGESFCTFIFKYFAFVVSCLCNRSNFPGAILTVSNSRKLSKALVDVRSLSRF